MVDVSKTLISQHGKEPINLDVIMFKTYLREISLKKNFLKITVLYYVLQGE